MDILKRLRNKGTIIALVAGVVAVLQALGLLFDGENVIYITNTVCGMLVLLGVLNNPTSGSGYTDESGE